MKFPLMQEDETLDEYLKNIKKICVLMNDIKHNLKKYNNTDFGSQQRWGILGNIVKWMGIETAIGVSRFLLNIGLVERGPDVNAPNTEQEGSSKEFYEKYPEIIDAMADLSRD